MINTGPHTAGSKDGTTGGHIIVELVRQPHCPPTALLLIGKHPNVAILLQSQSEAREFGFWFSSWVAPICPTLHVITLLCSFPPFLSQPRCFPWLTGQNKEDVGVLFKKVNAKMWQKIAPCVNEQARSDIAQTPYPLLYNTNTKVAGYTTLPFAHF